MLLEHRIQASVQIQATLSWQLIFAIQTPQASITRLVHKWYVSKRFNFYPIFVIYFFLVSNYTCLFTEDSLNLHPYKGEISKLIKNPNFGFLDFLGECYDEKKVLEMRESYVWVENEAQLLELVQVLGKETVFGVDTEQHSLRSFLGFTALIQVAIISSSWCFIVCSYTLIEYINSSVYMDLVIRCTVRKLFLLVSINFIPCLCLWSFWKIMTNSLEICILVVYGNL